MRRQTAFAYALVAGTAVLTAVSVVRGPAPDLSIVFWILLLGAAELLPVSLGFTGEMTMSFPIHLALALLFPPGTAMLIAGIAAFDSREFRAELPLWRALFNRAQIMLAVGAASAASISAPNRLSFPVILITAATLVIANLGLVAAMVSFDLRVRFVTVLNSLIPRPVGGFLVSNSLLTGLGAGTAVAYDRLDFGWVYVSLVFVPLLFARMSMLQARDKLELSERVQKQQQALLQATERVFKEREDERNRIAEDIHDSSLQSLAAAAYACGNAGSFMDQGDVPAAKTALGTTEQALHMAMRQLRESLVDLRRSSVEAGGLLETVEKFAEQISTLWGAEVRIEKSVTKEPPLSISLAAYQILHEALVNAVKHGNVSTVRVAISERDGRFHLVVQDDGRGFDASQEIGSDHHGMRLMRERAEQVGGQLTVTSSPGAGTRLEATLPGGPGGVES